MVGWRLVLFDDGDLFTDHENTILYRNYSWETYMKKNMLYQIFFL